MAGRTSRAWAIAAALLLLALPAAEAGSARAPAKVAVDAADLSLQGDGNLTLAFAGASFQRNACIGLAITGTARHLHLEVDRVHSDLAVKDAVPLSPDQVSQNSFDAESARVTISAPGAGCRILGWLDPGMAATTTLPPGPAGLQPDVEPARTYTAHASHTRHIPDIGGFGTVRTRGPAGDATVAGRLRMSVWEATLDVESPDGSFHVLLGQKDTPKGGVPGLIAYDELEAFLWLSGAHLEWALPPGSDLLASTCHVEAPHATAELGDAAVPAPNGTMVRLPSLAVAAPVGDLYARGSRLVGSLTPTPNFAPATRSATVAAGFPWGLAGATVPLSLVAISARRRLLLGARSALEAGRPARAARLALLVWPANLESRVARVVGLLQSGRGREARRALARHGWEAHPAARSFLQARLAAGEGDPAEARRHLVECFLLAPAFVADARADRALHGIVEAALGRVRALRGGPAEGYA